MAQNEIGPQPGPQTQFLSSNAQIVIYGGAAGGGKTYGLLLEAIRFVKVPGYAGTLFRRQMVQHEIQGGMWKESYKIYPTCGGGVIPSRHEWVWLHGEDDKTSTASTIRFAHIEQEKTLLQYQGGQIPFIGFDELTHFSKEQFFYMLGRNRSVSGVPSYIRATCNPDPDSWVKEFIRWWLDDEGRFADPEKSGVIRYFTRDGDEIVWADTAEEIKEKYGHSPISVTFIPAKLEDNKILRASDPEYEAKLNALPRIERERLKGGDWKIKATAGEVFSRESFEVVSARPAKVKSRVRFWDMAATEKTPKNNPDWTVGLLMAEDFDGMFFIENVVRFQHAPGKRDQLIKNTATQDGKAVEIVFEREPGASGKSVAEYMVKHLRGFSVTSIAPQGDKLTRAGPLRSQVEVGNVKVVAGPWNEAFFTELENFSGLPNDKDDQVDGASGAFNRLTGENVGEFSEAMKPRTGTTHAPRSRDEDQW